LDLNTPLPFISLKEDIKRTPQSVYMYSPCSDIDTFWQWKSNTGKEKMTQLQRYEKKNSPDSIMKFIAIGGGPKMGTTLEEYARFGLILYKKEAKENVKRDTTISFH